MVYYFYLFLFLIVLGQVVRIYFYHKQFIQNPTSEESMIEGFPLYSIDTTIILSLCFIFCLNSPLIAFIVTLSLSLLLIILLRIYKKKYDPETLRKIVFTPIWFSIFALCILLWANLIVTGLFIFIFNMGLKDLLEPHILPHKEIIRNSLPYFGSILILLNIVLDYRKYKLSFPFWYSSLLMFISGLFVFFEMM